jgi:hypothetical protein
MDFLVLFFIVAVVLFVFFAVLLGWCFLINTDQFIRSAFPKNSPTLSTFLSRDKGSSDFIVIYYGFRLFAISGCYLLLFWGFRWIERNWWV